MIKGVKRISIIGGSGTGKTTLANNLGRILNLPVCHIDEIEHFANWEKRNKEERDKIILEKVSQEKWIIDGTYRSTLKQRLENADLVIYLDYSSLAQLKGVIGRYIKEHGQERPEIPGCKERMTKDFFFFVLFWRKNKRRDVVDTINQIDKNKVLVFKNRRQLNKWYQKEFNQKIEKI